MPQQFTFDQWKRLVDAYLGRIYGLSSDDLPDWCYMDAWQAGVTPRIAAQRALRAAKEF